MTKTEKQNEKIAIKVVELKLKRVKDYLERIDAKGIVEIGLFAELDDVEQKLSLMAEDCEK